MNYIRLKPLPPPFPVKRKEWLQNYFEAVKPLDELTEGFACVLGWLVGISFALGALALWGIFFSLVVGLVFGWTAYGATHLLSLALRLVLYVLNYLQTGGE